ncbi:MAG: type II toxin-antitoxin system HicB family antitoxin [Vicingaceae bacterium]
MSNLLKYKDYRGQVEYSDEDSTFYGKILGINDLVSFEGETVDELKKAFIESVDDYIKTCESIGKSPEKEYKGQFNVRVPMNLHRLAARKAISKRMSLNKFVENALRKALQSE